MSNVESFLDDLSRLFEQIEQLDEGHRRGAESVVRRGRFLAPVATGRLRSTGRVRVEHDRGLALFGSALVNWAGPQNSGSIGRPQGGFNLATRFVDRARDQSENEVYQAIDDEVSQLIARF